jgi:hypothetical protein
MRPLPPAHDPEKAALKLVRAVEAGFPALRSPFRRRTQGEGRRTQGEKRDSQLNAIEMPKSRSDTTLSGSEVRKRLYDTKRLAKMESLSSKLSGRCAAHCSILNTAVDNPSSKPDVKSLPAICTKYVLKTNALQINFYKRWLTPRCDANL